MGPRLGRLGRGPYDPRRRDHERAPCSPNQSGAGGISVGCATRDEFTTLRFRAERTVGAGSTTVPGDDSSGHIRARWTGKGCDAGHTTDGHDAARRDPDR
jgi:hypothetical protein